MKINEEFISFQGEINVGKLAYFIRLTGCNLNCGFPCDSSYAWDTGVDVSVDSIYKKAKCFNRVVITGGEPFLQKDEVSKLIQKLIKFNSKIIIEIETNGTIKPVGLNNFYNNIIFNVSPKLKNSGNEYNKRIIPTVLMFYSQHLNTYNNNVNFKFVIDNENDIEEVEELIREYNISKTNVFLMPMGIDKNEQLSKLKQIGEYAKILGVNISPRLHILMYGNKRGV